MNHQKKPSILALLTVTATIAGLSLAACDIDRITESTSCADYMKHTTDERHTAAIQVSAKSGAFSAGNPMSGMKADSYCATYPDKTLKDVFN